MCCIHDTYECNAEDALNEMHIHLKKTDWIAAKMENFFIFQFWIINHSRR